MTNLPAQHPTLSLHLTDHTLTPLISSSSSQSHLESLTSLATTALTSQTAIQRVNLGAPQRIMIEYPDRGALILQSYLDPAAALPASAHAATSPSPVQPRTPQQSHSRPGTTNGDTPGEGGGGSSATSVSNGRIDELAKKLEGSTLAAEDAPPMLVSLVVAGSADQASEARRAAEKLERIGREFQREWLSDSAGRVSDEGPS
jgi:hypothetical protein